MPKAKCLSTHAITLISICGSSHYILMYHAESKYRSPYSSSNLGQAPLERHFVLRCQSCMPPRIELIPRHFIHFIRSLAILRAKELMTALENSFTNMPHAKKRFK